MKRLTLLAILSVLAVTSLLSAAEIAHEAHWATVRVDGSTADDLIRPEGRTRWQLESLLTESRWVRHLTTDEDVWSVVDRKPGLVDAHVVLHRASDVEALNRWLLPHRASELLTTRPESAIRFETVSDSGVQQIWVRAQRVGIGWLHLPSGPREVVLQKALVMARGEGERAWRPSSMRYRWIDPRAGVVAESWGRPSADGQSIEELAGAAIVELFTMGNDPLVIHTDELDPAVGSRVTYGFDRGSSTAVSSITPEAPANMGALIALGSWNLTGNNLTNFPGMEEIGSSTTSVNATETCNSGECGFTIPGIKLGREDTNFDNPGSASVTINATERELRPGDETIWLRAAVRNEGQAGLGVDGESRICYVDGGGQTRTEVPLFRFSNQDADGWFMKAGDSWSSDQNPATAEIEPFACERNIFFQGLSPCNCAIFCNQRVGRCVDSSCGAGAEEFAGTQSNVVVAEGPLTLPSGHTFNALVIRQTAEFCVFGDGSSCPENGATQPVRTVLWQWMVPHLGTLVRLQSSPLACQVGGLATLDETDIKFGLFPPRTITVESTTATTVELSWDPGLDTHRIGVPGGDDYRVYWDTDSGAASAYGFNSIDDAGQASVSGTSATISGLTAGVQYFFSVTARSEYANPVAQIPATYESLLYPTQVGGGGVDVPAEVSAITGTGCLPTLEVETITVDRVGGDVEICWDPIVDSCVDGYRIIEAAAPEAVGNFSTAVDTGLVTCSQFTPSGEFFLVGGKGAGGIGPLGHFGQ